jgi:hypothetical protein
MTPTEASGYAGVPEHALRMWAYDRLHRGQDTGPECTGTWLHPIYTADAINRWRAERQDERALARATVVYG